MCVLDAKYNSVGGGDANNNGRSQIGGCVCDRRTVKEWVFCLRFGVMVVDVGLTNDGNVGIASSPAPLLLLQCSLQRGIPPSGVEQGHEVYCHVQPSGNNLHPHSKMASSAAPLRVIAHLSADALRGSHENSRGGHMKLYDQHRCRGTLLRSNHMQRYCIRHVDPDFPQSVAGFEGDCRISS